MGEPKELKIDPSTLIIDGIPQRTKYYYTYSSERFERHHKEAFKISVYKSYRKNSKVKKKQWSICTMSYYDLLELSLYDCADGKIEKVSKETGMSADVLYKMIHDKLDYVIKAIEAGFKTTPEYKAKEKHKRILDKYLKLKNEFEKKYGQDTYDYCYDVFGIVRNKEYLGELQAAYKAKQKSYEYYSSYYENFKSNYRSNNDSSYCDIGHSTYTKDEKAKLKKIYKVLALKFHPDMNNGDADMMKFVNKLKEQWRI